MYVLFKYNSFAEKSMIQRLVTSSCQLQVCTAVYDVRLQNRTSRYIKYDTQKTAATLSVVRMIRGEHHRRSDFSTHMPDMESVTSPLLSCTGIHWASSVCEAGMNIPWLAPMATLHATKKALLLSDPTRGVISEKMPQRTNESPRMRDPP